MNFRYKGFVLLVLQLYEYFPQCDIYWLNRFVDVNLRTAFDSLLSLESVMKWKAC